MVFKGTPRHPNIPQELTARGARPNGTTWYDRTNYFETFAATDDNLRWALDLEADRMINSFIKEEDLKSEFSVVRFKGDVGAARAVYQGMQPLTAEDIARQMVFMLEQPRHVCIDEIITMPTDQGSPTTIARHP